MVRIKYVVCPLCAFNKVLISKKRLEKGKSEKLEWPSLDLDNAFILQIREGGGKKGGTGAKGRGKAPGSGFKLVPEESLTLAEMMESGDYDDVLDQMKEQLLNVVRQSLELGFIERSEI